MLKIRALNREASSDEDAPVIRREAQEEIALELYNKALRLQTQENFTEAESILFKLIDENIPLLEDHGGLPKSMSNFKYSCHINIGNIYLKLDRINDALERFLLASELDATDVTLWYKIGNLSLTENKFHQSAYAFAKGLECSESHWPCLDKLISVLFAIKDTIACLEYIGKALMLDGDYTKGLVLRRQIYRDNPATKDYYKLYNPDSIWEPPLDVSIADEDEKTYLEEAQVLVDRVNEAEKALAPKPLQTIALPKALTDYTWLCLTETIIYIHQYITDKGMSHFTMFDMSKCMSQNDETTFKFPQAEVVDTKDTKIVEDKTPVNGETNANEEKLGISEKIPERRFSQTSDTAMEVQESTPVQTDNDEEQNTEQDTEEQDETVEPKERGRPRGSKRKRDLLSDLQTWGWYSRRKLSKKAKEKDFTVEDAFERIIPKSLLPFRIDPDKFTNLEDSMNTMDLYNMYMQNDNLSYLSPIHSPKSVNYEQYFGTERERDDVQEFWTKSRENIDAVILIKDLVFHLSKLWHYKWPKQLVPLYITAYNMFREHYDPPQVFGGGRTFEELREDALASILFGELSVFSSDNKETIPPILMGNMRLISGWNDKWKEEYPSFFIRVFWLQSHLFRKENSNDLAVNSLLVIQEAIEEEELKKKEKYMLSLPNCFKYGLVNSEITVKILNHLDTINSLGNVENLYALEKYKEVSDILKATFSGGPWPQIGRMGRPAQLGILIHSLWYTNMTECFVWTEECLNEAFEQYLKVLRDQDKWEKILEKCLAVLYEIIKSNTVCVLDHLEESKRSRIIQNLAKLISKQLSSDTAKNPVICVVPWILLHFVLLRQEQREYAKKRINRGKKIKFDGADSQEPQENILPPSLAILFSAHEFLGSKGWCMISQGELPHFIIDTILDKLDTPIFEHLRDKIDIHVEQSMFCLYQHPSKKNKVSRHLADHNVDPIPLSWERASQLFEFYGPDCLPEYNSYKNASISQDLEQLFKRIIALVPSNNAPQQHLPKIMDYIHGKSDYIMDPIDFPRKVKAIYYLIGDFYFKQKEFSKCIKYFQMDLCINPTRLDSWACLGLSYAAQLDTKLNHCEKFKSEMEFLEKAKYASICFKKALELCPDPLMLLIECGTFQYTVHSYCSRIMKFESENLSMEKFEFLENQKNSYLDSSGNSFEKAIAIYELEDTNDADERWLQYYILGKIAEKKQKEPAEYLQYYLTANSLLEENKAEYPEKINYNNPQHLSVEALELHYRIHASVLKYLELHEGKDIPNTLGAFFKKCLSVSKYLKKPTPPAPPPPAPPTPELSPTDPQESNKTSCSFQEQFLNSLNKSEPTDEKEDKADEAKVPTSDAKEPETELPKETVKEKSEPETVPKKIDCDKEDVIVLSDSDDDIKIIEIDEEEKNTTEITEEKMETEDNEDLVEETIKTDEDVAKNTMEVKESDNKDENKVETIGENQDILPISEENLKTDAEVPKEEDNKDEVNMEESAKDAEMEFELETSKNDAETSVNGDGKVKDVQTLLDEMMMQTMKESEGLRGEVDSDLSGTEKVEEVVVKDEQEVEEVKTEDKKEEEKPEEVPKKVKASDGETDTDNKREEETSSSSSSSSSSGSSDSDSDEDDDDSSSTSSSSSSDGNNEFMSSSEISHLIEKCIVGLEICIIRLCQNYKALYRLAHLYFNYKGKKDLTKCKQLLLSEYKCKDGTLISGLFNDRKPNNFFNGIWRIPSTEIDRPGSLSAHMVRCLTLLMQILRTTNDNKTLIDFSVQLRRTPEPDKIYIKDSDRAAFSEQAMTMSVQSLRGQIKHVTNMSNPQIAKLLQEIFKTYQRLQKHVPGKEGPFATLLEDVYKKFIKEKIPENVNVLDLAIKFCSQNRAAEKQKLLGITKPQMFSPRGISTTPQVMPSPQTIAPPQPMQLKRPGTARPRGRPPLQKNSGQPRYQKPKSSSPAGLPKSYAWQKSLMDQSYAYEYLKHYQDELIKQYSQNLSIAQLTQLSSILTQGQINNPLTATAITSQMLAQTGLLNSNLLKQINSTGTMTQTTSAQLMDSLNQLNPNMKKKLGVDQALSSLTADQLKLLGTLIPKQGTASQTKPPTSSTNTSSSGIVTTMNKQGKQQSSIQRPAVASTSKSVIVDPSKNKTSVSASVISSPPKNIQGASQLFKEPNATIPQDDKTAKDLMKDRPNISITPVSLPPPPSVSPNFLRPTSTSPSSGKTLQEKLAEKKKEQQTKQMTSTNEGNKRQTDAFIKSLNIPSIPASLTVSPAHQSAPLLPAKPADISATMFSYPKTTTSSSYSKTAQIPAFPKTISSSTYGKSTQSTSFPSFPSTALTSTFPMGAPSSAYPISTHSSTFPKVAPISTFPSSSYASSPTYPMNTPSSTFAKTAPSSSFSISPSFSNAPPSSSFPLAASSSLYSKPEISSALPIDISMHPASSLKMSKEQGFPTSLTVSKAGTGPLSTPSFSSDSGMSISQVSPNQPQKISEEPSPPSKDADRGIPGLSSVVILPLKKQSGKETKFKKSKSEKRIKAVEITQISTKEEPVANVVSKQLKDASQKVAEKDIAKHSKSELFKKLTSCKKSETKSKHPETTFEEVKPKVEHPEVKLSKNTESYKSESKSKYPEILFSKEVKPKVEHPEVKSSKNTESYKPESKSKRPENTFSKEVKSRAENPEVKFSRNTESSKPESKSKRPENTFSKEVKSRAENPEVKFSRNTESSKPESKSKRHENTFSKEVKSRAENPEVKFSRNTESYKPESKSKYPEIIFSKEVKSKVENPEVKSFKNTESNKPESKSKRPEITFSKEVKSKVENPEVKFSKSTETSISKKPETLPQRELYKKLVSPENQKAGPSKKPETENKKVDLDLTKNFGSESSRKLKSLKKFGISITSVPKSELTSKASEMTNIKMSIKSKPKTETLKISDTSMESSSSESSDDDVICVD